MNRIEVNNLTYTKTIKDMEQNEQKKYTSNKSSVRQKKCMQTFMDVFAAMPQIPPNM